MEPIKKNNYYQLPTIITATKTGKKTVCTFYYGLVPRNTGSDIFTKLSNPEEITTLASRIKDNYFDNSTITDDVKGFIVAQTGYEGGKITFKAATFVTSGVNIGQSDQTNVWTQTIARAKSKYEDKNRVNEAPDRFRPMLADGSAVSGDLLDTTLYDLHEKYVGNYFVQYKLDGHRMICKLETLTCYSRTAETMYPSDELNEELRVIREHIKSALPEYAGYKVNLDGEYYAHGKSLQTITSAVRREQQSEAKSELVYHVFDIPITTRDGKIAPINCKTRITILLKLKKYFTPMEFSKISFIQTWSPSNPSSFKALYKRAIKDGYEGLVMKIADGLYEPGYNNYHSKQMIKIKELFREEFLISGYKTGKGKDEQKLTLVCKLTQDSVTKALEYLHTKNKPVSIDSYAAIGLEFKVRPAMDDVEAKKFYEDVMSGDLEIIGKLYTVEFRDWSDRFIPLQPVGKAIFN